MKAYIDSDVILDVLLGREDFIEESSQIISMSEQQEVIGSTTVLAIANIYYILNRYNKKDSRNAISMLREILEIMPITDDELYLALESSFKDMEDAIQNFVAEKNDCKIIITRNKKDFAKSKLTVYTPDEFLLNLKP